MTYKYIFRIWLLVVSLFFGVFAAFAADKDYPDQPNPPRLVNDFAHMLKPEEAAALEQKLDGFVTSTSNQITIVTISNLGGHDISEYSVHLFNTWGLGVQGKNNGVLLLVTLDDGYGKRKAWITVGKGLQGVLTDAKSGQIFRNELAPAFKEQQYFKGFNDAADAIIAVTKDEYKGDGKTGVKEKGNTPRFALIVIFIFIYIIIRVMRGGGGNNRGGGIGNFATGMLLGNMLGGGFGGGRGGDGGGFGGGGFGGFGGGSTDGGGAGGSW